MKDPITISPAAKKVAHDVIELLGGSDMAEQAIALEVQRVIDSSDEAVRQITAAKAEIVALREAAGMFRGCIRFMVISDDESALIDKAKAILARTSESYSGLVAVKKEEWEEARCWEGKSMDSAESAENWQNEASKLSADLAAQSERIKELEADKERLDWMSCRIIRTVMKHNGSMPRSELSHRVWELKSNQPDLRAAIDAAIAARTGGPKA